MVTGKAGLPQSVQAGGLLSILDMFFRKKRFFQRVYNANGNLTKPGQTNSWIFLAPCKLIKIKRHNPTWNPIRSTTTFKKLERLSFQTWCRNHAPSTGLAALPWVNAWSLSQLAWKKPATVYNTFDTSACVSPQNRMPQHANGFNVGCDPRFWTETHTEITLYHHISPIRKTHIVLITKKLYGYLNCSHVWTNNLFFIRELLTWHGSRPIFSGYPLVIYGNHNFKFCKS